MKVEFTVKLTHPKYGPGTFTTSKELQDSTTPLNMLALCTQHFIHLCTKMCHIMNGCYRNDLCFSDKPYDVSPGAERTENLTPEEKERRRKAVSGANAVAA
jgi:hypothetical protein